MVAQAGALWRDVYAALTPLGLAAVTGSCPTVGIAGFTLGGGWGPLSAEHGLGVDQVQAFRVALANGQVVEATANNTYSDLFWGLLGGGHGNFGVMTGITYNVFPLAEAATFNITWNIAGNATKAAQVLLVWQDTLLDKDPRGLSTWPHMYTNAFTGEQLLMIYATYAPRNMDIAAAEQVLQQAMQPLLALSPTASAFRRTPWSEMPALVVRWSPFCFLCVTCILLGFNHFNLHRPALTTAWARLRLVWHFGVPSAVSMWVVPSPCKSLSSWLVVF